MREKGEKFKFQFNRPPTFSFEIHLCTNTEIITNTIPDAFLLKLCKHLHFPIILNARKLNATINFKIRISHCDLQLNNRLNFFSFEK